MLDIPFPLETVPVDQAEDALQELISEREGVTPVLLGDRDVFSTEWAEYVDIFENPTRILAEARALDANQWFAMRRTKRQTRKIRLGAPKTLTNVVRWPGRLAQWPLRLFGQARDRSNAKSAEGENHAFVRTLKAQLAELEAAGEAKAEDLAEFSDVIAEIEETGTDTIFPDPVDYVTPRHGNFLAAGLVNSSEPWESAAWLQHGAYATLVPKAVFVAHCRWLWTTHAARLITASTDHVGFQMERPIRSLIEAAEVMRRFELLGATEINGDRAGSDGQSLLRAERLWVWWD